MKNLYINPRLTLELFDNELIMVNLDSGLYYTLGGTIVSFLSTLPIQGSIDLAIEKFLSQKSYNKNCYDEFSSNLSKSIKDLVEEQILVWHEKTPIKEVVIDQVHSEEYVPSIFKRYADMQDLLLLDPIHEVDEDGWTSVDPDISN